MSKMHAGVDVNMPTVRDPDNYMYVREWSGGILAGYCECNGRPCFRDGIPKSFEFQLLPEDWDYIRKLRSFVVYSINVASSLFSPNKI